ncbi:SbtR family transcriptional regulator [Streptomyces europaeiscabiei]|uniref:SbtR family transcriptional regulator n=1 Tax=Streptomyces europaeiscabiei TaxID=146819 RepID=UPI0038F6F463
MAVLQGVEESDQDAGVCAQQGTEVALADLTAVEGHQQGGLAGRDPGGGECLTDPGVSDATVPRQEQGEAGLGIHGVCAMQAADRGFADVLTMTFPTAKALEARRAEAYDQLLELITRAKNTGHLRDDFTHQDVVILLIANAGVVTATGVTATGVTAPDTWRRLVGHMLRSYAAPGAPIPELPEAPRPTALYRAMVRLSQAGPGTAQGGAAPG